MSLTSVDLPTPERPTIAVVTQGMIMSEKSSNMDSPDGYAKLIFWSSIPVDFGAKDFPSE